MRKILAVAVAALVLSPVSAMAANVHFVSGSTAKIYSNGHLVVNAKVAGLGNGTHTWTLDGTNISITAGCKNNSGSYPNGTQKFSGGGLGWTVTQSGDTVNGSIDISHDFAPVAGTIGNCPSGQTWTVRQITGRLKVMVDSSWTDYLTPTIG